MQQLSFTLPSHRRGFHLITHEVLKQLPPLPECGLLHLFIQHTSAALSLNENADPDVPKDLAKSFDHLICENEPFYQHTCEGMDDMPAHIKSTMIGVSVTIPITNHTLNLGTWQGIYLCEFRNQASKRHLIATII